MANRKCVCHLGAAVNGGFGDGLIMITPRRLWTAPQVKARRKLATSYIGEIEIGRRFPSLKLIDKIGKVLGVEPYRFFIGDTGSYQGELDETIALLAKLPDEMRLNIISRISAGFPVNDSTDDCKNSQ